MYTKETLLFAVLVSALLLHNADATAPVAKITIEEINTKEELITRSTPYSYPLYAQILQARPATSIKAFVARNPEGKVIGYIEEGTPIETAKGYCNVARMDVKQSAEEVLIGQMKGYATKAGFKRMMYHYTAAPQSYENL